MAYPLLASNNPYRVSVEKLNTAASSPTSLNPHKKPAEKPNAAAEKSNPAASNDIALVLNGIHIYDPSLPDVALYEISQHLNVNSPIKIRSLILDGKHPEPKYQDLYSFNCARRGGRVVIEIKGSPARRRNNPPDNVELRPSASIEDHRVWEIVLLQPDRAIKILQGFKFATASAPVMWRDGKGDLLALDTKEDLEDRRSNPMLKVLQDRDEKTMDLLVVAWCARIWAAEHESKWEREMEKEREREVLGERTPRRSILGIKW